MSTATEANAWVHTLETPAPDVLQRAWQILENTLYCTLSTCSPDGLPWVSPVFFVYDQNWQLYWSSATASKHSQNLYRNQGRVAIAVYGTGVGEGKGQGLYLNGTATELAVEHTALIMQQLVKRAGNTSVRTEADYLPPSYRRLYHFRPQEVWITGERLAFGNVLVDTKIQLNLADLAAVAS